MPKNRQTKREEAVTRINQTIAALEQDVIRLSGFRTEVQKKLDAATPKTQKRWLATWLDDVADYNAKIERVEALIEEHRLVAANTIRNQVEGGQRMRRDKIVQRRAAIVRRTDGNGVLAVIAEVGN